MIDFEKKEKEWVKGVPTISLDEFYKDYKANTEWKVRHRDKYKKIITEMCKQLLKEFLKRGYVKIPYFCKIQLFKYRRNHKNNKKCVNYLYDDFTLIVNLPKTRYRNQKFVMNSRVMAKLYTDKDTRQRIVEKLKI